MRRSDLHNRGHGHSAIVTVFIIGLHVSGDSRSKAGRVVGAEHYLDTMMAPGATAAMAAPVVSPGAMAREGAAAVVAALVAPAAGDLKM